jgi:hypothetical protein
VRRVRRARRVCRVRACVRGPRVRSATAALRLTCGARAGPGCTAHYWGANGCLHDFRDLCNENYYHHHVHPFLQHTDWLDGGERLEQAHKFDEQEELAFQEATKELHNKVMVEREDWNAEMKELHQEKQVSGRLRAREAQEGQGRS